MLPSTNTTTTLGAPRFRTDSGYTTPNPYTGLATTSGLATPVNGIETILGQGDRDEASACAIAEKAAFDDANEKDDEEKVIVADKSHKPIPKDLKLEPFYPEGGLEAWSVVFGAWILTACFIGLGLSWGIFITYYETYTFPHKSPQLIQFMAGIYCFTQNGMAFFAGRLGERFGYKRMMLIACCGTTSFLFAAAFCTKSLVGLFLTQSIGVGLSNGLAMPLVMAVPSQWFKRRRGLASGIAISGSGIGGAIATLIIRALITRMGPKKTLLIFAGIQASMLALGFLLIRVRDVPENRLPKNWLPQGIWRNPAWYSMAASVFFGVFGFLTPYFFITSYTQEKVPGLDPTSYKAAVPLTLMNLFSGLGRIAAGYVADKIGPVNSLFTSFFIGCLAQMVIWPFVRSFGSIIAFSIINGFFGAWFMGLLATACSRLFGSDGIATMTGFMVLCNSPGQLLGSTISSAIFEASGRSWLAINMSSGGFMLAGAMAVLPARFLTRRKLLAKV